MPARASWVNAFSVPVVMDTTRARDQLAWTPEHGAHATLEETVEAARAAGTI